MIKITPRYRTVKGVRKRVLTPPKLNPGETIQLELFEMKKELSMAKKPEAILKDMEAMVQQHWSARETFLKHNDTFNVHRTEVTIQKLNKIVHEYRSELMKAQKND